MNQRNHLLLFWIMVLSILVSSGPADTPPHDLIALSGGQTTITELNNGTYSFDVKEVIPYVAVMDTNDLSSPILPVDQVMNITDADCSAILSTNATSKEVIMGKLSSLAYSQDAHTRSFILTPIEYYEGTLLKPYQKLMTQITPGKYEQITLYIESPLKNPNNMMCTYYCPGGKLITRDCLNPPGGCFLEDG